MGLARDALTIKLIGLSVRMELQTMVAHIMLVLVVALLRLRLLRLLHLLLHRVDVTIAVAAVCVMKYLQELYTGLSVAVMPCV
jgi:hypothetical protein